MSDDPRTHDVQVIFRDGGGMVTHRNAVETYSIGEGAGSCLAVVTAERTRTGNLRRLKYPWSRIASVADEHRPHLGSTKSTRLPETSVDAADAAAIKGRRISSDEV